MKQLLLTTTVIFLASLLLSAGEVTHHFVKEGSNGQGTSWKDAFGDLQQALAVARPGEVIWVAQGTYLPTTSADRTASFIIPSGVAIYGGFAGTEKKLEERSLHANLTILSGEIGDVTDLEDNSYTIVYFSKADATTQINGFVITGGYANGMVEGADLTTCGAAVYNNGEFGVSSPKIEKCIFVDNFSREGAAIYNYANQGDASPLISDCKFINNRSDFNGGAIFNDGSYGTCNPTIKNCHFEGNYSMYGAGLLNRAVYGICQPVIVDCAFVNNFSVVRGGAIYNQREGRGTCEALVEGCVFEDNGSTIGNGDVDETVRMVNQTTDDQPGRSSIRQRRTTTVITY